MTAIRQPSICRSCDVTCPVLVDVDEGVPVRIVGDPTSPVYQGYSCMRGRAATEHYVSGDRLLHSLKRQSDGTFAPIASEHVIDEIADRLVAILEEHGPTAIASYVGTSGMVNQCTWPMQAAFMGALGNGRMFNAVTIDQPGKAIALGLMGFWEAGAINAMDVEVTLIVGSNPLVSSAGGRAKVNTVHSFHDARRRGLRLVVVDPCLTETAKLADHHLRPRPGQDIAILAGIARLMIEERLYDEEFVDAETCGLGELRRAVAPYTAEEVARRAELDADEFRAAARAFAGARSAIAIAGTGPNMACGNGTLLEYLVAALNVLHGSYLRAGDRVWEQKTLAPQRTRAARAVPPFPSFGFGEPFRAKPLADTVCGPPTAAAADEMLLDGDGRIRAFISVGGNPLVTWPDQLKVRDAFRNLELLVQVDPWMTATAREAHYVIAPKLQYEVPGISNTFDLMLTGFPGIGMPGPWGQYTPALVDPPPGSDVITEWEFFFGLAARIGLELEFGPTTFNGKRSRTRPLDMTRTPDCERLLEMLCDGSRIPLDEVRAHPHGLSRADEELFVAPKELGWEGRLDLANERMMGDLQAFTGRGGTDVLSWATDDFPLRLVSRRISSRYNSSGHHVERLQAVDRVNPLRMHPDDAVVRNLHDGDLVQVASARATVPALLQIDATMRQGVIALTHAWGGLPDDDDRVAELGSAVARLSSTDEHCDPYSGQPVMTNIPVEVRRHDGGSTLNPKDSGKQIHVQRAGARA
jgi:anaerobic selenocysteine-containing dehydrogenase